MHFTANNLCRNKDSIPKVSRTRYAFINKLQFLFLIWWQNKAGKQSVQWQNFSLWNNFIELRHFLRGGEFWVNAKPDFLYLTIKLGSHIFFHTYCELFCFWMRCNVACLVLFVLLHWHSWGQMPSFTENLERHISKSDNRNLNICIAFLPDSDWQEHFGVLKLSGKCVVRVCGTTSNFIHQRHN